VSEPHARLLGLLLAASEPAGIKSEPAGIKRLMCRAGMLTDVNSEVGGSLTLAGNNRSLSEL